MLRIGIVILAASTDQEKIDMTQRAIDSLKSKHSINTVVVESHSRVKYPFAETLLVDKPFNYNHNLKAGVRFLSHPPRLCDYYLILNNDVVLSPNCLDKLVDSGMDSCSPKDPTLNLHEHYKGIVFGFRTSYQVCGWALMFSKEVMLKCGLDTLFPDDLPFWYQDNFYAHVIQKHGFSHALICDAHCIHLESKSHDLLHNKEALTNGLKSKYDELIKRFDLQFSER